MVSHAGGISLVAFVVAVAVSMGYYQYMYVPQVNAKPILPDEVLNPPDTTKVTIVPGASLASNGKFYVPKDAKATLGINNHVVWTNTDPGVGHTVTSDDGYTDQINGKFDSLDTIGVIASDQTYEFTFTKVGTYGYHCEPHPHMQGTIEVIENFA